jgi:tyrosyl-tRNA synthetase
MDIELKSDFLRVMQERGFIHQCTNLAALDEVMATGPMKAYIGFDLTADSLHVGSLIQLMVLRHLISTGHTPVILFGGATTRIGDPTGKDSMRPQLTPDQIETNEVGILKVVDRIVGRFALDQKKNVPTILNNLTWMQPSRTLDYLREYGPHFTINRMLTLDSVKTRLERQQPMTFLEFNYMLFQAIDFRWLNSNCDIELQIGGSDQWGNIVNGVDLIRRMDGEQAYGLTTPLLANSAGEKMGKTAGGAVWLDPDKTSPFDFWQFWYNIEDGKVASFLRLFTELDLPTIRDICALDILESKSILATEITSVVHGHEKALEVLDTVNKAKRGEPGEDLVLISCTTSIYSGVHGYCTWADMFAEDPTGEPNLSKGETTRLVANGGIKLDGVKLTDAREFVKDTVRNRHLQGKTVLLTIGKKRAFRISFPEERT